MRIHKGTPAQRREARSAKKRAVRGAGTSASSDTKSSNSGARRKTSDRETFLSLANLNSAFSGTSAESDGQLPAASARSYTSNTPFETMAAAANGGQDISFASLASMGGQSLMSQLSQSSPYYGAVQSLNRLMYPTPSTAGFANYQHQRNPLTTTTSGTSYTHALDSLLNGTAIGNLACGVASKNSLLGASSQRAGNGRGENTHFYGGNYALEFPAASVASSTTASWGSGANDILGQGRVSLYPMVLPPSSDYLQHAGQRLVQRPQTDCIQQQYHVNHQVAQDNSCGSAHPPTYSGGSGDMKADSDRHHRSIIASNPANIEHTSHLTRIHDMCFPFQAGQASSSHIQSQQVSHQDGATAMLNGDSALQATSSTEQASLLSYESHSAPAYNVEAISGSSIVNNAIFNLTSWQNIPQPGSISPPLRDTIDSLYQDRNLPNSPLLKATTGSSVDKYVNSAAVLAQTPTHSSDYNTHCISVQSFLGCSEPLAPDMPVENNDDVLDSSLRRMNSADLAIAPKALCHTPHAHNLDDPFVLPVSRESSHPQTPLQTSDSGVDSGCQSTSTHALPPISALLNGV
ncbi:hypothetical protein H4S08_002542 [Coemansia sp. RSA 1365]|nr:hypothetical protein H4S08_002542 [Coemansia sp. RSA 1365]